MLCAKAAFAAERAKRMVEMVPACAACKAFLHQQAPRGCMGEWFQ